MSSIVPIDDPADPRIEAYLDIRERDLVGRQGLFVAEGEVVMRILVMRRPDLVMSLLLAEKRVATLASLIEALPAAVPVYSARQAVMDRIAGFPMHRGIIAIGRREAGQSAEGVLAAAPERSIMLVLFGIANHDNMGGIFRNAAAFGADAVILDPDCCDPLYRKAIRVSVGGALVVPFARLERGEDAIDLLAAHRYAPLALAPNGATRLGDVGRSPRMAMLLGAEGPGLPPSILEHAKAVRIPMAPGFDSLNVATASGIVLHHLLSDRGGTGGTGQARKGITAI